MANHDLMNIAIAEHAYEWKYVAPGIWKDLQGEHRTIPDWAGDLTYAIQLPQFITHTLGYRVRIDGPHPPFRAWVATYYDTHKGTEYEQSTIRKSGAGKTLEEALTRATLCAVGITIDDHS